MEHKSTMKCQILPRWIMARPYMVRTQDTLKDRPLVVIAVSRLSIIQVQLWCKWQYSSKICKCRKMPKSSLWPSRDLSKMETTKEALCLQRKDQGLGSWQRMAQKLFINPSLLKLKWKKLMELCCHPFRIYKLRIDKLTSHQIEAQVRMPGVNLEVLESRKPIQGLSCQSSYLWDS